MRVRKKYKFMSINLREMFELPCVKAVFKDEEGKPILIMDPEKLYMGNTTSIAFVGDFIEEMEDGKFQIIRSKLNWLYV